MKIVKRKAFLNLPPETIFAEFEPVIFGELRIKGENVGDNDFYYSSFIEVDTTRGDMVGIVLDAMESGESIPLHFNTVTRYGSGKLEDDSLFVVFEERDVEGLLRRLGQAALHIEPEREGS